MADEDESVAADGVGHRPHVLAEGARGVILAPGARMAVAGQIDRDHSVPGGEVRHLRAPVAGVTAPAVDEDQGGLALGLLLNVVDLEIQTVLVVEQVEVEPVGQAVVVGILVADTLVVEPVALEEDRMFFA